MIFFNPSLKKIAANPGTDGKTVAFHLTPKNCCLLWLCQCLNIAVIAVALNTWMFGLISLSLIWQALLLFKGTSVKRKLGSIKNKRKVSKLFSGGTMQVTNQAKGQNSTARVSPWLLAMFALFGCLAIAVTAKQAGLLVSMVHLLCFSYVLKAFELRARSDFYQLLLLALFVLASALIFRQDLVFSLLILALLLINLAVLLQFFSFEKAFAANIKLVALLLGQSMVLAIVLFLVFPRLTPFWQVPMAKSAATGLSDTVKPGDVASLSRSTKLAFRADFNEQAIPAYSELYWRAMVLENYDGRQWTRKINSARLSSADAAAINKKITHSANVTATSYQVIAEPSFQRYLFVLAPAIATGPSANGIISATDYTLRSRELISQTKAYQVTSYLTAPLALDITKHSKAINLAYPSGSNPRLEKLALQLQQQYPDVLPRAQAILTLINQQNYSYTLQPPLLQNNSLDQFFFDTKAGFCVHYASTFTFLMRAAGVPARMVTGYLGGEYNTAGGQQQGHLSIYQYDAHAWSEIWVQGKGWLRIDPTGAVDAQRVNSGWSTQLQQEQSALNNDLFSLYRVKNNVWLNTLRLHFDALDYQWTRWVIGFSDEQQYDLLKSWFGKMLPWKFALIIGAALMVSMTLLMFFLLLLNRTPSLKRVKPSWQHIYEKALNKLAKQGLEKPSAMTANDFAKQVRQQYPELAIAFTRLNFSYNCLCYKSLSLNEQERLTLTIQQQYQQFVSLLKQYS